MKTMRALATLSLFLLPVLAVPATAQELPSTGVEPGEELVDRVIAVVGDTALLLSDVREDMQSLQASGRELPSTQQELEQLARQLVDSRVDDLVLLQAARNAGTEVDDAQVMQLVEQNLEQVREQFGSEAALTTALEQSGLSMEGYRATLMEQQRDQLMTQAFVQERMATAAPPPVTEEEMEAFFAANREQLGDRPAMVSFRQIIVQPRLSTQARAEARDRASGILEEIRGGADFETVARRVSEDPGTRERGGDLGWFRRGQMVRPFEDVAFALRPGRVSDLVDTDFGVHIIKVERTRTGERQARHILIRAELSDEDHAAARTEADSIAEAVRGGASWTQLARQHETPGERRTVERVPLDNLPEAYVAAFEDASDGDIVGPFALDDDEPAASYVVAQLTGRAEAGEFTLADVREQVRGQLEQQKMVERLVEELRDRTYVSIRL